MADNYPGFAGVANEMVARDAGAAHSRARSMCSMKHVGMNVAADAFMTLSYGNKGGMVIIVADDPNVHSSQNEQEQPQLGSIWQGTHA